jgi:hypothetical protein
LSLQDLEAQVAAHDGGVAGDEDHILVGHARDVLADCVGAGDLLAKGRRGHLVADGDLEISEAVWNKGGKGAGYRVC